MSLNEIYEERECHDPAVILALQAQIFNYLQY